MIGTIYCSKEEGIIIDKAIEAEKLVREINRIVKDRGRGGGGGGMHLPHDSNVLNISRVCM